MATEFTDSQMLDWLDRNNQLLNDHYGTRYGWKVVLSPNVTRVMTERRPRDSGYVADVDVHDSRAHGHGSIRAAIAEAMRNAGVTTCRVDEIPLTDEQRKLLTVTRDVSIPGAAPERQPLDVDLPERVIDQLVAESGFTYIEPEEHHVYSLAQAIKREVLARIPNSALARGVEGKTNG